jgi:hypothetical protein
MAIDALRKGLFSPYLLFHGMKKKEIKKKKKLKV